MSLKYEPASEPLHISVDEVQHTARRPAVFFFFTLVTGPTRSLSLKLSDTRVYEPQIRARLGTVAEVQHCARPPVQTVDYDPFIKSQLAS